MLPLDSSRWNSLNTYFGSPDQVPQRLAAWRDSIGEPDEASQWSDLCEQFLHQFAITDAAYTVVPHIVHELDRIAAEKRLEYLVAVAFAEAARQKEEAPVLLPDLGDAYYAAIARARDLAMECLPLGWPKTEFRFLLSILVNLHGHPVLGDLLFNLEYVYGSARNAASSYTQRDKRVWLLVFGNTVSGLPLYPSAHHISLDATAGAALSTTRASTHSANWKMESACGLW